MSEVFDQATGRGHYAPVDPPQAAPPVRQQLNLAPQVRVLKDDEHIKQTLIHNGYATSAAGGWASSLMQAMISRPYEGTPQQLVRFCCDVAEEAVAEFQRRGWAVPMPSAEDVIGKDGISGAGFTRSS